MMPELSKHDPGHGTNNVAPPMGDYRMLDFSLCSVLGPNDRA